MNPCSPSVPITKECIIEQKHCSENLPQPLFAKEGEFLPFVQKGGREGFSLQGLHYFGLTDNSPRTRSPPLRPSHPPINFPSPGGWKRRTEKCFRPYVPLILLILCRTWRDGRVDEGVRLEIVYPERDRGFEFLSLRVQMIFNAPW